MPDVKVEVHFRAGDDLPWVATWDNSAVGAGQASADRAADALELAGQQIAALLEQKSPEELELERAVNVNRRK